MQQDTTLVIVSYNSAHLLEERLRAYADRPVVVVDNASTDGSSELISSSFPEVQLIENEVNSGYGRAANLGFERVATPYALLVNPDARIGAEGIADLEAEASGLADGWLFVAPNIGLSPEAPERVTPTLDRIRAAYGAALLFNMESLRRLGGFDPNIFLFFEETDLCRRARDANLDMYYARGVPVEHEIGTSTHRTLAIEFMRKWHYNWSRLYFFRKYRLWGRFLRTLWINLVVAGVKLRIAGRDERKVALLRARHSSARAFLFGRAAFQSSGAPCAESTRESGQERFERG
jgi:N-acetylglucosaminyl-diphospho-decaprenol L-rhamnosyltransferase